MENMATSTIKLPESGSVQSVAGYIDTAKFEYQRGGYSRFGNMVFVNIRVAAKAALSSGVQIIFSDGAFPVAMADGNGERPSVALCVTGADGIPYINLNGSLRFGADFSGAASGATFNITGAYVTDE